MPPEDRDPAYLWDMLTAALDVIEFVRDMKFHQYEKNKLVQAAVERKIEVIGEAARNVTREFQELGLLRAGYSIFEESMS